MMELHLISRINQAAGAPSRSVQGRVARLTHLGVEASSLSINKGEVSWVDGGRWLTEPCECGCSLPCIDSVKGREVESFRLPSGKIINGEFLTTIFDSTPEIARGFHVIQHKDRSITVECIPSSVDNQSAIKTIVNDFATKLGGEVPVECKFVDEIAHDRGKLRFVVREK